TVEAQKYKNEFDASFKKVQAARKNVSTLRNAWINLARKQMIDKYSYKSDNNYSRDVRELKIFFKLP
ncbi:MAG: hypothetical protein WCS27_11585, partial [Victivallaceae bacterium]